MTYSNLTIDNYRGIRHCEIDGLSRINLFFGKNNCGKSSVLESLFILSGPNLPVLPLTAYVNRGIETFTEPIVESMFYAVDRTNKIKISTSGISNRKVVLEMVVSRKDETSIESLAGQQTNGERADLGLDIQFDIDSRHMKSHLTILNPATGAARLHQVEGYHETMYAKFLTSQLDDNNILQQYAKVIKQKQEETLFTVLRVIEPRLIDIQIGDGELMVDVGYTHRIPIKALGDGIRRAFSVILSIQESAGGVLMIDELENGLHHTVLKNLWETIIVACKTYDVQLFATTHSHDLIKDLAENGSRSYQPMDVAAYRLVKTRDDEVKALRYDYETLQFNINQEIEVR